MPILSSYKKHTLATQTTDFGSQWGDHAYFCHATHHSAGVALLFNIFTGDILKTYISDTGRWCIVLCKLDNALFIM